MIELNATLIAQIINFLILVAILAKVAYKPLMKILAEREARIAGSIEAAEQERTAAEQLKQEYQRQLAQARSQAQEIVDKAAKLAEQTREEILTEARAEHARLLKAAQDEIVLERERALGQLRKEVVELSVVCAAKIIGQSLDTRANEKMIDEYISRLDREKIGGLSC